MPKNHQMKALLTCSAALRLKKSRISTVFPSNLVQQSKNVIFLKNFLHNHSYYFPIATEKIYQCHTNSISNQKKHFPLPSSEKWPNYSNTFFPGKNFQVNFLSEKPLGPVFIDKLWNGAQILSKTTATVRQEKWRQVTTIVFPLLRTTCHTRQLLQIKHFFKRNGKTSWDYLREQSWKSMWKFFLHMTDALGFYKLILSFSSRGWCFSSGDRS